MSANNVIRGRVPGQAAMSEVIALHRAVPRRTALQRFFGVSPLAKAIRPPYLAALGELTVGETLDHIGPEWDVLHVIPVGGDTPFIDHLVIGPPGVFAVTTRNLAGQEAVINGESLTVDGKAIDIITATRAQSERAGGLLSEAASSTVVVAPVIAIVDARRFVIRRQPEGLEVISSKQLLYWLTQKDRVLDGRDVAVVSDLSDRGSTWHSSSEPVDDAQQLHREFTALRDEVVSAAYVRVAWALVGFLAVAIVVWTTVAITVHRLLPLP